MRERAGRRPYEQQSARPVGGQREGDAPEAAGRRDADDVAGLPADEIGGLGSAGGAARWEWAA